MGTFRIPPPTAGPAGSGHGRGRRGGVGNGCVRRAAVGRGLHRPRQPERAGEHAGHARVRPRHGRRGGAVPQPGPDRAGPGLPGRRHREPVRPAEGQGPLLPDVLVHRVAPVRRAGRSRDLRGAPAGRRHRRRPDEDLPGHQRRARRPGPGHPRGRADPDRAGDQRPGQGRHRPGRGDLHAGAADPAAGDLRQPGRRGPAAGDRRGGHPRLVRRAAAADPGHRRVDLLHQHHHHPGPGPGHRLRAVHDGPVPGGTAQPALGGGCAGPHRGHRRPDRRRVRRHRRGRAGRPDAVPRDVPALHGLWRRGDRRGGHAGRADRHARAARGARLPGQRAAHPPLPRRAAHEAAGRGRGQRRLVPHRPQRHAPAGRLRGRDRGGPARARLPVPLHHLGRHGRPRPAGGRRAAGGPGGAGPRLPGQRDDAHRGGGQAAPGLRGPRRSGPPWPAT